MMRAITHIVIHCSATRAGQDFSAADIDRWHAARGFHYRRPDGSIGHIGYHYVVRLDGRIEKGRPDSEPGAHVKDHNATTIGICYIGGLTMDGRTAQDTRTPAQVEALRSQVAALKRLYPEAKVVGHRDFPGVHKDCPSFDVATSL